MIKKLFKNRYFKILMPTIAFLLFYSSFAMAQYQWPTWLFNQGSSMSPSQVDTGIIIRDNASSTFTGNLTVGDMPTLFVDAGGNVGIGTGAPDLMFEIAHSGNDGVNIYSYSSDATYLGQPKMNLGKSHNDAIGSLTETVDTEILGNLAFWGVDGADTWRGAGNIRMVQDGAATTLEVPAYMNFLTNSGATLAERMRLTKDGNILLGSTTNNADLYVYRSEAGDTEMRLENASSHSSARNVLRLSNDSTSAVLVYHSTGHSLARHLRLGNNDTAGDIRFWFNGGDNFVLEQDGDVGINTAGPDRKLDILDATNPQIRLTHTDGSVYAEMQSQSDGDLTITTSGSNIDMTANVLENVNNLELDEITTPTAVANHGKVYTKTDNNLYFQDGAGVEHTLLKGASSVQHEFFTPLEDPTGTVGNWDIIEINAAQSVHFSCQISEEFEVLDAATIVMIPDATETIQWDIYVSVAAAGEAYNNDDRSAVDQTLAVTSGNITEVDISGQLTGLAAGDYVAIDFQSDTANLRIVGFEFDFN